MREPDLRLEVWGHHLFACRQWVPRSTQDPDPIINERFKVQAVGWIRQALGTQHDVHVTTLQHRAEFMHEPCPHLDNAIRVVSNESGHCSAEETTGNNGRCSNPEFAHSSLGGLVSQDAGLFLGETDGLSIAGEP